MDARSLAGKPPLPSMLVNVPRLVTAYYAEHPDAGVAEQRVKFGTSGHRGSSLRLSFNEAHILAITQAICEYRAAQKTSGPLYLGMDTHALSEPAFTTALEVLAANGVEAIIDAASGYTPTPAVSHAILTYNRGRADGLADGIVITPSHNPPEDGGFKYNPPHGGPADTTVTKWMEQRANQLLAEGLSGVKRIPYAQARAAATTHRHDYIAAYVADLGSVIDMPAIRSAGPRIGVDPLGGAAVAYWEPVARALRPRSHRGQHRGRSHVSLHDARLGRQDPYGLLVPLRHGEPHRVEGPLRRGVCERHRQRSPRHRHALRGADESESLPGRRDLLPLPGPHRLAERRRRGQDRGQQRHDRPRRAQAEAHAGGSARGVQVVRQRIDRRLIRLRRRGERGRFVSAARRRRVDHR